MPLFGGSKSTTRNESNETIFNNVGDGQSLNLSGINLSGKGSRAKLNLNVQTTDHQAIKSAFDFAESTQSESSRALQSTAELAEAGLMAAAKTAQPARALAETLTKGVLLIGAGFVVVMGVKAVKK